MTDNASVEDATESLWKPLRYTDRRVAGALIEKSKTTPDSYPLTLNSLQTACNQKSNRFPQLQLSVDQIYDAVERLQACDAVQENDGDSRSPKYRHKLYQWLGVDKVEIAVMGELLLRGAQTLGELRGRSARMEPIASLAELRPIVDRLYARGLMVYLTPPGRGCVVTHALYEASELQQLRSEYGGQEFEVPVPAIKSAPPVAVADVAGQPSSLRDDVDRLRSEVAELRELVQNLQASLAPGSDDGTTADPLTD